MQMLKIKRAYDKKETSDGKRILIDRLWPRGVTKAEADIDEWFKELGPSTELRKWFGHDPERWPEFKERFTRELSEAGKREILDGIAQNAKRNHVTLIYSAKDTEHSNAKVLQKLIQEMMDQAQAR
jgi:uncharacterized protein YeaO (DUF488 family)